ncbi:MAG: hypothetical protein KBG09_03900 [Syntrophobacterales bacterium]|nr:hypothetical protein [Syntrophobacterales bacterium]
MCGKTTKYQSRWITGQELRDEKGLLDPEILNGIKNGQLTPHNYKGEPITFRGEPLIESGEVEGELPCLETILRDIEIERKYEAVGGEWLYDRVQVNKYLAVLIVESGREEGENPKDIEQARREKHPAIMEALRRYFEKNQKAGEWTNTKIANCFCKWLKESKKTKKSTPSEQKINGLTWEVSSKDNIIFASNVECHDGKGSKKD